ncbi:MAG: hypothetical protein RDV41_04880 [Planctomycetota bacterium]|nr:hypothetical protein [Planctomycetota bacterium]
MVTRRLLVPVFIILSLACAARSADAQTLSAQVKEDPINKGKLVLEVSGTIDARGAWVGRSFYPAGCKDAAAEGVHGASRVRQGSFKETWTVPDTCIGGAFELALWETRVSRRECQTPMCPHCASAGYHFENLLASASGYCGIAAVSATPVLQPDMKTIILNVSGTIFGGDCWLGVSTYPLFVKDPLKDGHHTTLKAARGTFSETVRVSDTAVPGTYGVVVWAYRVEKKNCSIEKCRYCAQLGCHMDGLLAATSGDLTRPVIGTIAGRVAASKGGGKPGLTLTGEIIGSSAWIGLSLYPPGCADPIKDAEHFAFFMKEGKIDKTITVPDKTAGGSFEAALWSKRVRKSECPYPDCPYCALLGYHMEGQITTCTGKLEESPP